MLLFSLRLMVAAYFMFSAVNKVFFFNVFSKFLSDFTGVDPLLSAVAAAIVISVEGLFSLLLIWIDEKMILRAVALCLSVPFIIYNAYIFFILNYHSCNCAFSTSGESLTHPLFSIFILSLTLLVTFLTTREKPALRGKGLKLFALITAVIIAVTLSINYFIWDEYSSGEFRYLSGLDWQVKENNIEGEEKPGISVFVHFSESSADMFLSHLSKKLGNSGKYNLKYHIVGESDYFPETNESLRLLSGTGNSQERIAHLGVQLYLEKELIYRRDSLPEMSDEIYQELLSRLIDKGIIAAANTDLFNSVKEFVADYDPSGDYFFLLMDRVCRDCDAELLALLESFTWENEKLQLRKIYFINDFIQENYSIAIPAQMAVEMSGAVHYPNKLLIVSRSGKKPIYLPVPPVTSGLEEELNRLLK